MSNQEYSQHTTRTAAAGPGEPVKSYSPGMQTFRSNWVTILLFVAVLALTAALSPGFFTLQNIMNVARQASIMGVVALGMTFVILTGGIDLSVGSILAVVAVVFAVIMQQGVPVLVGMVLALLLGTFIGLINGVGITFLGIQPFIMTLATMAIGNGIALVVSEGAPKEFSVSGKLLDFFGNWSLGKLPGPVFIFASCAGIALVVLRFFRFGRFIYAVGGSMEAARLSGVRTTRVLLAVYAVSGLCAALAGLMTAARLYVGHPTAGGFIMLDSIAAVVIGGTNLMGGRGGIPGTIAGAFLLTMVANLLNLLGVSPFNQQIAKGLIIVVAVLFTAAGLKQRIKEQWTSL